MAANMLEHLQVDVRGIATVLALVSHNNHQRPPRVADLLWAQQHHPLVNALHAMQAPLHASLCQFLHATMLMW